ncbi:MAG: hypothetical protein OXC30_06815 [Alphaproteobacteria bacterium]|nr:hypothetical protein [Alphaproteobacteria bacterium]
MLTVLPAYSASDRSSYESDQSVESVASVFRVQNQADIEDFQTKLRHLLKQRNEIRARIEGLVEYANFFSEISETNTLFGDMILVLDEDLINSMGAEFSKVNVPRYMNVREDLMQGARNLRGYFDICRLQGRRVSELILVDKFLNGQDKEVCSHPAQDTDTHDSMSHLENFLKCIKDTKCLVEEHLTSVSACINSVDGIVQGVCAPCRSYLLFTLCDKFVLRQNLQHYRKCHVEGLEEKMCTSLDLFAKCLEKERVFRSRGNPLVVLLENSEQLTLEDRRDNLRDNLDKFMQMECEISARLEKLAGCATFFIQYDFAEYVRRFPQLGVAHAWYDQVLKRQVDEFINIVDCLRCWAGHNFSDIVRAWKILHERDDDSMLPPIQVKCDLQVNDLCGNLEIFITILKEIKDWEENLSRQKESLQKSLYGVVCDQTAAATLVDQFPYIKKLQKSPLRGGDFVRYQNKRRKMVEEQLSLFSECWQSVSPLETLQNPEDQIVRILENSQNPADQIFRLLDLWSKYLKQDIDFVRDPLVSKNHCDNVICHLNQFLRMEDKIISRIAILSSCALFFLQHNIKNDILWPQLRSPNVEWYREWGIRLFGLAKQFTVEADEYQRLYSLLTGYKILCANDANSVLTPTAHAADWGRNLKNFIAILQDTQNWQAQQCVQGELLYSSVWEMLDDQGAERALGDSTEQQRRLREYLNLIRPRSMRIDWCLSAFLGFLNTRNSVMESVRQAQGC